MTNSNYSLRQLLLLAVIYLCVVSPLSANTSKDITITSLDTHPDINLVGRYVALQEGGFAMSYPGVSITFNAVTDRIKLEASSTSGNGSIDVLINEQYSHTITLNKSSKFHPVFFSESPEKVHVKLINRSETWQSVNHVKSLELSSGKLLPAPVLPKRNMLVIGDSVSCASAVSRGKQCEKHIKGHDPKNSYAMKLGRLLDANVHLVCFGGRGIVRSYNENPDDMQAPAFAKLAIPLSDNALTNSGIEPQSARWDHDLFQPSLVLVSLGTNDFNPGIPEKEWFESTYVAFINTLKGYYPEAKIAITEGAMLNDGVPSRPNKTIAREYLTNIVNDIDSQDVTFVPSNHYPGDKCDPHPTAEQHQLMALDLADEIRRKMNW